MRRLGGISISRYQLIRDVSAPLDMTAVELVFNEALQGRVPRDICAIRDATGQFTDIDSQDGDYKIGD